MSYELKREDIFSFADYLGIRYRQDGSELNFEKCPYCEGGIHNDKETFSINLEKGCFKCLRSSCGKEGHFVELCRDFDYKLEFEKPKIYRQLKQPTKTIESKETAIEYMKSRGICEDVTRLYQITTRKDNDAVVVFPFYDEQGKLQFVKYRNTAFKKGDKGNKEWCEKDTMPILFGMNIAREFYNQPLIITEGQIDSLSVAQAGYLNVVSVPTGASGFTWLTPCREWIEKFSELIVFGDYENGKMTLVDTLKQRLSMRIRTVRIKDYLGEKDANDILRKYGVRAIQTCINNAEEPAIRNVIDLATVENVNLNEMEKIKTGIYDIDHVIKGLCVGQLIIVGGKQGEGKSTFASQIIANALDQRESVFCYSGELPAIMFKSWLNLQLAGSSNLKKEKDEYGEFKYYLDEETDSKIRNWYKGRMFLYDINYLPSESEELESLSTTIEKVIKTYNTRLIVVDNLMTAMDVVVDQNNFYLAQSNFVLQLKQIAMKYQVVVLLLAHIRKTKEKLDNTDISGSGDISNRADIVMLFERKPDNQSSVKITKNRLFGVLKSTDKDCIMLNYSPESRRVFGANDNVKHYGWEEKEQLRELTKEELSGELPF